jgi:hypothetical protein
VRAAGAVLVVLVGRVEPHRGPAAGVMPALLVVPAAVVVMAVQAALWGWRERVVTAGPAVEVVRVLSVSITAAM